MAILVLWDKNYGFSNFIQDIFVLQVDFFKLFFYLSQELWKNSVKDSNFAIFLFTAFIYIGHKAQVTYLSQHLQLFWPFSKKR